jgi:hypothetical protein
VAAASLYRPRWHCSSCAARRDRRSVTRGGP